MALLYRHDWLIDWEGKREKERKEKKVRDEREISKRSHTDV